MLGLAIFALALVRLAPGLEAQETVVVPEQLNYQGVLETLDGTKTYTNGLYDIEFRIWNASTAGTLLWGQKYSVYVSNGGYFNVVLGEGGSALTNTVQYNNLRDVFRTASGQTGRYLGLTVRQDEKHANISNPLECTPRQQLLTGAFAFQAQYAQYANQATNKFYADKGLAVSGDALTASAGLTSTKGLTVSGAVATVQNGLTVSGTTTLNNGVTVNGSPATLNAGLDVSGTATFRGTTTLNGAATLSSTAALNGATTLGGTATFSKAATFNDTATFAKAATFNEATTFSKTATFNETNTFAKNVTFKDKVTLKQINADTNGTITLYGKVSLFHKSLIEVLGRPKAGETVTVTARDSDGFLLIFGYNSKARLDADLDGDGLYDITDNLYFATSGSDTMLLTLPMAMGGIATYRIDSVEDNGYNRVQWLRLGR